MLIGRRRRFVLWVFYGFLIVGLLLLVADLSGRLVVPRERVRWWRWIGLAAAAGPGIAPLLYGATGVGVADLVCFATMALGVLGLAPAAVATMLRRGGYVGLLVIGALPSWALISVTPFVALAGIALARAPKELPAS
jgi:hypothetical protein